MDLRSDNRKMLNILMSVSVISCNGRPSFPYNCWNPRVFSVLYGNINIHGVHFVPSQSKFPRNKDQKSLFNYTLYFMETEELYLMLGSLKSSDRSKVKTIGLLFLPKRVISCRELFIHNRIINCIKQYRYVYLYPLLF